MKGFSLVMNLIVAFLFSAGAAAALGSPDKKFITDAAVSGMAEVELAELASQKAESEDVRAYAAHLLQQHKDANEKLKALASEKNVSLPTDLDPKHKQIRDKLSALEGPEFDKAYVEAMIKDHKKAVNDFQTEAKNGKDKDVKEFAKETVPALKEHLDQAQKLQANFSSSAKSSI
jgi:putative membrane protein